MNNCIRPLLIIVVLFSAASCASIDGSHLIPKLKAPIVKAKAWMQELRDRQPAEDPAKRVQTGEVHASAAAKPPTIQTPRPVPPPRPVEAAAPAAPARINSEPKREEPPEPTFAERAFEAYKKFQFDEVLRIVDEMDAGETPDDEERATAYILAGAALVLKGNSAFARWHFGRARHLVSDLRPNGDLFPQSIIGAYNQSPPRNPNRPEVDTADVLAAPIEELEAHGDGQDEPATAIPKLRRGETTLRFGEEFCFSLEKKVTTGGDIGFTGKDAGDIRFLVASGGTLPLGSGPLEDVLILPEHRKRSIPDKLLGRDRERHEYQPLMRVVVGQRYAVLCADGLTYAAIRITEFPQNDDREITELTFEWRYTEGSRYFGG